MNPVRSLRGKRLLTGQAIITLIMITSNGVNKQNLDKLEREVERRLKQRAKRKRKRMRVSGSAVKKLQKILVSP